LTHPRMEEITGINMANSCCGDDFFEILAERCTSDGNLLPNLQSINAETNLLTYPGVKAIADCIASPTTFMYLQEVKLENQKVLVSSKAEFALAKALYYNRSIIKVNLSVRNLLERQQINKYVVRNIDLLRQARRHHAVKSGTLQDRPRSDMEQLFDKIAANDASIDQVDIVGNLRFMSLQDEEKLKAARAFATNTHVKKVKLSMLQLDDKFAAALGESLKTNCTIDQLLLDSNAISGEGMKALFGGLAVNTNISELQVRHQSKTICSADEDILSDLLEPNKSIIKLGIDLRSQLANMKLNRKFTQNRDIRRKQRNGGKT